MAGKDWLCGFLKLNPTVSLRKQPTSLNRISGMNRYEVEMFYRNLQHLYYKHSFGPNQIFNVDETGFSTVPPNPNKCKERTEYLMS